MSFPEMSRLRADHPRFSRVHLDIHRFIPASPTFDFRAPLLQTTSTLMNPPFINRMLVLLPLPCKLSFRCARTHSHVLPLPAIQPFVDETGAPTTLPEMGNGGEESKIKVLLGLLRK